MADSQMLFTPFNKCYVCNNEFDDDIRKPMVCCNCNRRKCQVCSMDNCDCQQEETAHVEDDTLSMMLDLLKMQTSSPSSQFRCTECGISENEQKLNVCKDCNFELFIGQMPNFEQLIQTCLCSFCALRNHSQKAHSIVDFYIIFSSKKFDEYNDQVAENRRNFMNSKLKVDNASDFAIILNQQFDTKLNELLDTVRRTKSRDSMVSKIDKIQEFLEKAKKINENINKLVSDTEGLLAISSNDTPQIECYSVDDFNSAINNIPVRFE